MHYPRSLSAVRRLRLASLLLLLLRLLIPITGGLLVVSIFANDPRLMVSGLVLVAIGPLLLIVQWVAASRAGCPLCGTPVLAPMGCVKHRKARRLLGSYKLRVALAILFTERFRCPYCNEPTAMQVRERLSGPQIRGSRITEISRLR